MDGILRFSFGLFTVADGILLRMIHIIKAKGKQTSDELEDHPSHIEF